MTGDQQSTPPEVISASQTRLAALLTMTLGVMAGVGYGIYAWGPMILAVLSAVAGPFRLAALGMAVAVLLISGLLIACSLVYEMVYRQQMILERDQMRLIRVGPTGERELARIPYRNIARVVVSKTQRYAPLCLGMHDPGDPDMAIHDAEGRRRVEMGLMYRIPGRWAVRVQEVAARLRQRCGGLTSEKGQHSE